MDNTSDVYHALYVIKLGACRPHAGAHLVS